MNWYKTADPIQDEMYGGIPDGGGYSSATEYEVGAQRTAEAVHCILGSLGKALSHGVPRIEVGHIQEEMGLIENFVEEYAKPVYIERVWENSPNKERSYQSIINSSNRLKQLASSKKSQLEVQDEAYRQTAEACYDIIYLLSTLMLQSVENYPEMKNAFASPALISAVQKLRSLVERYWS